MHHVCSSGPTQQAETGRSVATTSRDIPAGRFLCRTASFALFGCTESKQEPPSSGEVCVEGEEDIRAYVPLPDWEHQRAYLGPGQFTYDAEGDVYVCPEGTLLHPYRRELTAEKVEYRAEVAICHACPRKGECTPSEKGRSVHRSFHADYLDRVRGYHETEPYTKAMRKRKVWIEPLFGEAKQWHGMRRFRLRGLAKVNMEGLFIAAGQNLKRLLSATGWGRHPWPDGAAGFAALTTWRSLPIG